MNEKQRLALVWAILQAGELERFHQSNAEYYKLLPSLFHALAMSDCYGIIKISLLSLIETFSQ